MNDSLHLLEIVLPLPQRLSHLYNLGIRLQQPRAFPNHLFHYLFQSQTFPQRRHDFVDKVDSLSLGLSTYRTRQSADPSDKPCGNASHAEETPLPFSDRHSIFPEPNLLLRQGRLFEFGRLRELSKESGLDRVALVGLSKEPIVVLEGGAIIALGALVSNVDDVGILKLAFA